MSLAGGSLTTTTTLKRTPMGNITNCQVHSVIAHGYTLGGGGGRGSTSQEYPPALYQPCREHQP